MKQTAVEWLADYLVNAEQIDFWGAIEQAKQMEKEQIIKAHDFGYINDWVLDGYDGEQYYNETFKSE